jgi:predicted RND superfamily exporter protein
MSNASKNKALIFLVIILLLTNIAVLAYFLWPKQQDKLLTPEKNKYKLLEPLKNEVGFTDSQIVEYKKIRDSRTGRIKSKVEDLRRVRDNFYRLLSTESTSDSSLNIYSDSIAYRQKLLDLETFTHFKVLRKICTPDQEAKYDTMVQRIVHRWGSPIRNSDPRMDKPGKN